MKKLFNASFEQSLNIKDDSLVQYMIQDTEKRGIYNGKKRWVLLIIAIVFIFVQYGFVIVTEVGIQNPDQDSFVAQANINMLPRSVFWLLFLIYLFIWLYTKKYNNDSIKIFITMNTVNNYLILGFMEIEIKNYGTVLLGLTIYAHVQVRKLDLVTKRKSVGPILIYAANILGLIMAIAMIPAMLNGGGEELTLVMVGLVVLPIQIIAIVFFVLTAKDIKKAYPNMKEEAEDARKRYKEIKDRN